MLESYKWMDGWVGMGLEISVGTDYKSTPLRCQKCFVRNMSPISGIQVNIYQRTYHLSDGPQSRTSHCGAKILLKRLLRYLLCAVLFLSCVLLDTYLYQDVRFSSKWLKSHCYSNSLLPCSPSSIS